ncbi:O99 family O-antigen export ABC transporter permease subunit, partial [Escherichia coli]|nr:O99 family O-antigen export ABC transporter permease subunit [Escherichia coli]
PIVYVRNILPDWSRGLIDLNPMAVLIEAYQKIILFQQQPDWYKLLPVAIIAIIIFMFSWSLFRKHAADIVDEI